MPANPLRKPAFKINGNAAPGTSDSTDSPAPDLALWAVIRKTSEALSCGKHLCLGFMGGSLPDGRVDAYASVKAATEAFVAASGATAADRYAFNDDDLADAAGRAGLVPTVEELNGLWEQYLVSATVTPDLIELIWSYWIEQSGLVKSMEAIARRFAQDPREGGDGALADLELDPLRPLNNLLWGYIEDEPHRVSAKRRAYEYSHEYGLTQIVKAGGTQRPAGGRMDFLRTFHYLLYQCGRFYRHDGDTLQNVDGAAILAALQEVHLLLSKRAEKKPAGLWSTIRAEMLVQQRILARPEFGEFLPIGGMVAYPEPWMDRVDTMRRLMGWGDASVIHFRNLAVYGECILLSIRYGAWSGENDPARAASWARFWRPEVQGYVWAYRAVADVDLSRNQVD